MANAIHASRPARHGQAIVLFADAAYVPFAHWTAQGLLDHGSGAATDIVILSPDRAALNRVEATGQDVRLVQIADGFAPYGFVDVPEDFPNRSFLNLFAPHVFDGEYARLILCDSDYVIGKGDMPRLFGMNMKAYPLAAMRDIIGLTPDFAAANEGRYYAPAGIKPSTPYLNGGFQLIDVARYLAEQIGERALRSTLERGGPKWLGDQRALNAVLRGDWMELSPHCNWAAVWPQQAPAAGHLAARMCRPCGLHLLGAAKPWSDRRPKRIDPEVAVAMRRFFAGGPWDGLVPEIDLAANARAIEGLAETAALPEDLFTPEVLGYLTRPFEDVAQGAAPGYVPQHWALRNG